MLEYFTRPKEKHLFWIGLGIGILLVAILRSYIH
jgi:hypothetical protein